MVQQKEHVLFCFISLPVLAHGQIFCQLPTVSLRSTSPNNGQKFSVGPDPGRHFVFLPELFQQRQQQYPQAWFCVCSKAVSVRAF